MGETDGQTDGPSKTHNVAYRTTAQSSLQEKHVNINFMRDAVIRK